MASTTALTMVNRLLRRHGYEDTGSFTEPEALLALDLVNQAINTLLTERDYPWNVRSSGTLTLLPPQEDTTGGWNFVDANTAVVTGAGFTGTRGDYMTGGDAGNTVVKVVVSANTAGSGPANNTETAMEVQSISSLGTVELTEDHPGFTTATTDYAYKFIFNEYLLPNIVAKMVSVRHQSQPTRLIEVDPHSRFDEVFPRPHDNTDDQPFLIAVGGTAKATTWNTVATASERLRVMVYPTPTARTVLHYTYVNRQTELSATTDAFISPREFVDDVIDRAEALSNMTQRWNDPALAQLQLANSIRTAERKWRNTTLDPQRRHGLRAHDAVARPRDPTVYRDVEGL